MTGVEVFFLWLQKCYLTSVEVFCVVVEVLFDGCRGIFVVVEVLFDGGRGIFCGCRSVI